MSEGFVSGGGEAMEIGAQVVELFLKGREGV